MKKHFVKKGTYAIKVKGRGIIHRELSNVEAQVLFRLYKHLEMESIELLNHKGDCTYVYTQGWEYAD